MSVKETKEALVFGFAIAKVLKGELSDGFQKEDIPKILEKLLAPETIVKLQAALEGMEKIPAETSDLGLVGGLELARFLIGELKTF